MALKPSKETLRSSTASAKSVLLMGSPQAFWVPTPSAQRGCVDGAARLRRQLRVAGVRCGQLFGSCLRYAARRSHHGLMWLSHSPARPIGKAIVTPMKSAAIRNSHRSGKLSEKKVLPAFTSSVP